MHNEERQNLVSFMRLGQ